MSYAPVQNRSAVVDVGNYVSSLSDTFASSVTVGNLIVVTGGGGSQGSTYTVSDNKSNTYTVRQTNNGANYSSFVAWALVTTGGTGLQVTVSQAGQKDNSIQISEWSGAASSGTEDAYTIGAQTSNAAYSISVTTTAAADLIVSAFAGQNSFAITSTPSGYTSLMAVNGTSNAGYSKTTEAAYKIAGAAATETATWTDFDAAGQAAVIVAFKTGSSTPAVTISSTVSCTNADGSVNVPFTVSPAAAGGETFNYATADNTATQPAYYTQKSGTVTLTAGQTTGNINVVIKP